MSREDSPAVVLFSSVYLLGSRSKECRWNRQRGSGGEEGICKGLETGTLLVHNGLYHVPFPVGQSPSLEPVARQADIEFDFRLYFIVEAASSVYVPFPWTWRLAYEHSEECLLFWRSGILSGRWEQWLRKQRCEGGRPSCECFTPGI